MQTAKYIYIKFDKPLYKNSKGYFIRIRDKYINNAIKYRKKLKITLTGVGSAIYTPQEWLDNAEYTEQVFLRPNEPMKLYGNFFNPGAGLETQAETKRVIEDVSLPLSVRERLKNEAIKQGWYR